jgi:exonuclease VII small subunit|tara:strand:+ start:1660 stop:1908 length:249 start_codon:yes stop_codon:yes gene_type:complete
MKDKFLLDDIENKSIDELTEMAVRIIENLENQKDLEQTLDDYKTLVKLNNVIEKKFQKTSREITDITKNNIYKILKNGKKIK